MNAIVENLTGMQAMTDQVIAADMLIASKTGIKSYAIAISEAASPEIREVLHQHLEQQIAFHTALTNHMIGQGWYKAFDIKEQMQQNVQNAYVALGLSQT
ncbi:spore coat protein [Brevibacillus dissolubilis]|uniref:spore coat protein n=1 Tax=Brevibacillus dissolubilis TaxID=1844116 RepID=UPI0011166F36|nr:spore coat protein [Brevibacillus dissolubilis]